VKREKPCPLKTIEALHAAGGIAILAHPYLIDETVTVDGKNVSRDHYIRRLFEHGLDGIETAYTYDKTSYKGTMTPEAIRSEVLERYGKAAAILSGGSDYHADHKKGVANPRRIGDAGVDVDYFKGHSVLTRCLEGKTLS
jgi:fructose-bisphosphate aldolase class II